MQSWYNWPALEPRNISCFRLVSRLGLLFICLLHLWGFVKAYQGRLRKTTNREHWTPWSALGWIFMASLIWGEQCKLYEEYNSYSCETLDSLGYFYAGEQDRTRKCHGR